MNTIPGPTPTVHLHDKAAYFTFSNGVTVIVSTSDYPAPVVEAFHGRTRMKLWHNNTAEQIVKHLAWAARQVIIK